MSEDVRDSFQRQPDIHPSSVCMSVSLLYNLACPSVAVTNRMQRKWWSEAFEPGFKRTDSFYFSFLRNYPPCCKEVWGRLLSDAYHAERPCRMKGHPGHCSFSWGPSKVSAQTAELHRWTQSTHSHCIKPLTQFWLSY